MSDVPPRDLFLASLARCRADPGFLAAFYGRFLASSEEVAAHFRDVDIARQTQMLAESLRLAAEATQGSPEGLRELRDRAESHDRNHHDVRPELYELWLGTLLETAGEVDPEWDSPTQQAWGRVLRPLIRHMAKHY